MGAGSKPASQIVVIVRRFIRGMLEKRYAEADCVVLALDNLNTHGIESVYETYRPTLALAMAKRLEIYYTPRHGSWLNITEIELSAVCGQCLNRGTSDVDTMRREIEAWERDRNNRHAKIDLRFKTPGAHVRLSSLCPKSQVINSTRKPIESGWPASHICASLSSKRNRTLPHCSKVRSLARGTRTELGPMPVWMRRSGRCPRWSTHCRLVVDELLVGSEM